MKAFASVWASFASAIHLPTLSLGTVPSRRMKIFRSTSTRRGSSSDLPEFHRPGLLSHNLYPHLRPSRSRASGNFHHLGFGRTASRLDCTDGTQSETLRYILPMATETTPSPAKPSIQECFPKARHSHAGCVLLHEAGDHTGFFNFFWGPLF